MEQSTASVRLTTARESREFELIKKYQAVQPYLNTNLINARYKSTSNMDHPLKKSSLASKYGFNGIYEKQRYEQKT